MSFKSNKQLVHHAGTSLAQLLIAMLISSILMSVAFSSYSFIKKQLSTIEQQINILYGQNVADFLLRFNIRQSGYKGYVSSLPLPQYSSVNISNQEHVLPKAPIAVCKAAVNSCKPFVTNKILYKITNQIVKPNTEILVVYDVPKQVTLLTDNMIAPDQPLLVASIGDTWVAGEQMIIADCQHVQRFVLSNIYGQQLIHDQPYNITNSFIKKFKQGAEVFKVQHLAFYIARNASYQSKVFSLYVDDLSSNNNHSRATAILDHIEDFSVQVLDPNISLAPIDAVDLGWVFNKYLLIKILFKNNRHKLINKTFTTGVEILNGS